MALGGRPALTKQYPDGGQTAGQGRDSREPPARPLAALVHSDGSTEELQPPGAAGTTLVQQDCYGEPGQVWALN